MTQLRTFIPLTLAFALVPAVAAAATLQVGPGKPYTTIADAVAAAGPGDTVEVDPGDYVDDIVAFNAGNITVKGVGDTRAHVSSTSNIGNGKGIFLVNQGADIVTVEHLEFSGATVADGNGAGIRMQGSALVVRDCHFHDNENGILAGGDPDYTVEIYDSEFDHNGVAGSGLEHNVYVSGNAASFTFQGNYSHHAYSGHTLKSRAKETYVLYNRIMDEQDGTSSYVVDLPQGGLSYVIGNLIEQGPMAENHGTILNYKEEGQTNDNLNLYVVNNTIVNDNASSSAFVHVWAADVVLMRNNLLVGAGTPLQLENGITPTVTDEANLQTDMPGLVDRAGYDYHLVADSVAIDAGVDPGMGDGYDLTPTMHYLHPTSTEPRPVVDALDVGAYEFGEEPPVGGSTGGGSSGDGGSGESGGAADGSGGTGDSAGATAGGSASATTTPGSGGASGAGTGGSGTAGAGGGGGSGCGCASDRGSRGPLALVSFMVLVAARRRRGHSVRRG